MNAALIFPGTGPIVILTSHGGVIADDIPSAWRNSLIHLFVREEKIKKLLASGNPKARIIEDGVFFKQKSHIPEPMRSFLKMWDTCMFNHHEQALQKGGLTNLFPDAAKAILTDKPLFHP